MQALLFAHPRSLKKDQLVTYATQLNLDVERFQATLAARQYQAPGRKDSAEGKQRDVRGVPTVFLNDTRIDGVPSLAQLQALVGGEEGEGGMGSGFAALTVFVAAA